MDKKNSSTKKEQVNAEKKYPGVAIDVADDEKVDKKTVRERTETLNNNPRNDAE